MMEGTNIMWFEEVTSEEMWELKKNRKKYKELSGRMKYILDKIPKKDLVFHSKRFNSGDSWAWKTVTGNFGENGKYRLRKDWEIS